MSESDEASDPKDQAREKEVDAMLQRKFQHADAEHPAIQMLMKEARRHWIEALKERDED